PAGLQAEQPDTHALRVAKAAAVAAIVAQSAAARRRGRAGVAEAPDAPGGLAAGLSLRRGLPLRGAQFQSARTGGAGADCQLPAVEAYAAHSAAVDAMGGGAASGGCHRRPLRARARLPTARCRVEISRRGGRFS